ncbi:glycoside hydrolase family 2 TIM barrel-domain containing protein [Stakelama saccharophila]|uniref:Glycoside hydrolase family 2 TIM barrel-domain containing protein n=1 Tax=Stakelama saccharophila TaxID=3075605 RepID=A0ABZ0B8H4_9SPHN|nr:sugar-binding domain-containing protein [Stakelama sp. W311]WNO53568.1 glycoside hydrolase family 2 TIM barrel-domain containing protein [Stakelama sp. W311]
MIKRLLLAGATSMFVLGPASALAQTAPPSPKNPAAGSAGFTRPGTVEAGNTYVGPILSKWGREVTAENAWRDYPRPQMKRDAWLNLNGNWDYAITKAAATQPTEMDGKILVPFAVESRLSGVARHLMPEDRLWYRRSFTLPADWPGKRTLLHFGAVDYESTIWVNGKLVGSHKGGFDPFTFDITDFLQPGANEIAVGVTDPTSMRDQPRGKQTLEPRGIWYTAVSGIWQTVWLEPVPDLYIKDIRTTPDIDKGELGVDVALNSMAQDTDAVRVTARADGKVVASTVIRGNRHGTLRIPNAHLWSPDDPYLYDLTAELVSVEAPKRGNKRQRGVAPMTDAEAGAYARAKVTATGRDRVDSYFGMRKISTGTDPKTGKPALLLNNKPLFQNGTLDQGWWPGGLLTPPSEEAARDDILFLKKAGFNMLRKHIKVEPAQYYYDADRLGMLIWQDMPSGAFGDQSVRRPSNREATMSSEAMAEYQSELSRMIGALRNFPSIVMWVTNNEGWGQYDAKTVARLAKDMDPSRLVDATSGWMDVPGAESDVFDIHTYDPVPDAPTPHGDRPLVIGEYGGVGLPIKGHLWFTDRDARIYQFASDREDYRARYKRKFDEIVRQAKEIGLAAAIYTETSDVEGELNGLRTYDRAVEKLPASDFAKMAAPLFSDAE